MHIRTFRAANLNAALTLIREQMGPDAAVLHTRQVPSGLLGFLGRNKVEVTAGMKHVSNQFAVDDSANDHAPSQRTAPNSTAYLDAWEDAGNELIDEYSELGVPTTLSRYWLAHCTPDPMDDLRQAQRVHPIDSLRRQLQRWFLKTLGPHQPIEWSPSVVGAPQSTPRIVALVGATGVGKTTTIAKLAAQFRLRHKAKVGLLTLDSFRAAAVEQIQAFASAMQMPLQVIRKPDEAHQALQQFSHLDLILVDTVGQSPRTQDRIRSLADILHEIRPHETHLVIDANSSAAAARDNLLAFSSLAPTACILSKTDEVQSVAAAMSAILNGRLQMSYITTGQMVPEDLDVADTSRLADWMSGLAANGLGSVISSPEDHPTHLE